MGKLKNSPWFLQMLEQAQQENLQHILELEVQYEELN